MSKIAYDKSVEDYISQLSATGHVTHRAHRKTMVTLHHVAGDLSHDSLLRVWQSRPASTHFHVDRNGTVAQFVKVNEYAWATGNTKGNTDSISIEMSNKTRSPSWEVREVTWKEAARLAGWLFAKVIGERPTKSNLVPHHHWRSTSCAGPYIDRIWSRVLAEAQSAYDQFTAPSKPAPKPTPTPAPAEDWQGKVVVAKTEVRFYRTPGWHPNNRTAGILPKGYGFRGAIHDKRKVGGGYQYLVSNSNGHRYWITANERFVSLQNKR